MADVEEMWCDQYNRVVQSFNLTQIESPKVVSRFAFLKSCPSEHVFNPGRVDSRISNSPSLFKGRILFIDDLTDDKNRRLRLWRPICSTKKV